MTSQSRATQQDYDDLARVAGSISSRADMLSDFGSEDAQYSATIQDLVRRLHDVYAEMPAVGSNNE